MELLGDMYCFVDVLTDKQALCYYCLKICPKEDWFSIEKDMGHRVYFCSANCMREARKHNHLCREGEGIE
nr:hypothetical protein pmam_320 [Pithovirus mammoth]